MIRHTAGPVRIAAGVLAGVIILSGCSGAGDSVAGEDSVSADSSASEAQEFNDADVVFAQGMIPHHEDALVMSEVALQRAADPRVRDLAERIEAGQQPEIELMTGWLEEWGEPLDAGGASDMDHGSGDMDHGSGGMGHGLEGMAGMEDMPAAGPDFDLMWLQSMIEHHDGAVVMAQTEIDAGANREAIDVARLIVETQSDEIDEMQQLVDEIGG